MSSMGKTTLSALLFAGVATFTVPHSAFAQSAGAGETDAMTARYPSRIGQAVQRWQQLIEQDRLAFGDYAGFITTYPDFPQQDRLQQRAEAALDRETVTADALVAFFDRNPPITNGAKARYALSLATLNRPEAFDTARGAWRGGTMSGSAEAYMQGLFGTRFSPEDHDARMDALLWQGDKEGAARQIVRVSPGFRQQAMARLALLQGTLPAAAGVSPPQGALSDSGYVFNLAGYYRDNGRLPDAVSLLATRPTFARPAYDPEDFVTRALRIAQGAGADPASRIAGKVDDLFAPGADVSAMSFRLRDDYTSLMWLGGTKALWTLGDGKRAAPLFYRYGAAARTPQTRSKGFYWAGRAAQRAGAGTEAARYFEMAAAYPERFYGQLALKELGRPLPSLAVQNAAQPSAQQRAAFERTPLVAAVREVAKGAPWRTGIQFYRAVANQAQTPEEHALVAQLALETGRRDLAVNLTDAAGERGHDGFVAQGYPVMPVPPGSNWTMVHAITRQESQFAGNAISHAGARGLMQLMPGTAREQAGKLGMTYLSADLIESPTYNIRLGNAYFSRMMDYYRGSYPLAIAAYNAGPGNVNKWLRANGDPRNGGISWIDWIEQIPIFETRNYVQRVIENAAVYEQLNPDKALGGKPRTAGDFLR